MSGHFIVKFIFVLINLIFLISGIGLTIIASIDLSSLDYVIDQVGGGIHPTLNLVLGVGIFIIVLSLLGLFAGCTEKSVLLTIFGVILIILLILQFAAAVVTFVMTKSIVGEFQNEMNNTFYKNDSDSRHFFNKIQTQGKCCGINNVSDYTNHNYSVPKSCCSKTQENNCTASEAYTKGCLDYLSTHVSWTLNILALVDIIFCVINIVQITFTFCLVKTLKAYIMV